MFRSTTPRLAMAVLISVAAVPFAMSGAAAAPRDSETVVAYDQTLEPGGQPPQFVEPEVEIYAGGFVRWVSADGNTSVHSVTFETVAYSIDITPGEPAHVPFRNAGEYPYYCKYHGGPGRQGMSGVVKVAQPPPPTTTTTTEPPPTTTTTAPPPTTTTTAPAPPPPTTSTQPPATTTTTRRAPGTTTTQPPASASSGTPGTTSTTAKATTTTGKASTTTAGKKKPGSTTTTMVPETTTTVALPADWIPTPDMVPDGSPTTTTTGPEIQAAASPRAKGGKGGGGGGFPAAGALALAVLFLGGGGWAWYHRSSRYLPA